MNATANILALTPELRESYLDWKAIVRKREEQGFEWAPAQAKARAIMLEKTGVVRTK